MNPPDLIAQWIQESTMTVCFTGAGISTESGIPDFRSPNGVWSKTQPVMFLDFVADAAARLEYWRQKAESHRHFVDARPNVAHRILAEWEREGRLHGVMTQNIDGLHQIAGSHNVRELHGTARRIGCLGCAWNADADALVSEFVATHTVPECPACGGLLKHATVSFGQQLPRAVLAEAIEWSETCRLFIVLGSSLVVHPAAGLPELAGRNGARLVIVNRDATPLDGIADCVINDGIGLTMEAISRAL